MGAHTNITSHVPLRDHVGLDVAIVVLGGPNEAALGLERQRHHVVDEAVLVAQARGLELGGVVALEHLRKRVEERAVVLLQDGVLRGQVQRVLLHQRELEARARKLRDRLVGVVHREANAGPSKVVHLHKA